VVIICIEVRFSAEAYLHLVGIVSTDPDPDHDALPGIFLDPKESVERDSHRLVSVGSFHTNNARVLVHAGDRRFLCLPWHKEKFWNKGVAQYFSDRVLRKESKNALFDSRSRCIHGRSGFRVSVNTQCRFAKSMLTNTDDTPLT